MARGKNTPALFEVIRNAQEKQKQLAERDKQRQAHAALAAENAAKGGPSSTAQLLSPAAQLLKSPIYWFKGKHAHDAAGGLDAPVLRETPARTEPVVVTQVPAPKSAVTATSAAVTPPAAPQAPVLPTVPMSFLSALPPADAPDALPATAFDAAAFSETAPAEPTPTEYAPHSAAADAARQVRQEMAADISAQEAAAAPPLFSDLPAYSGYDGYDSDIAYHSDPTAGRADAAPAVAEPTPFSYSAAIISAFAVVVTFGVVYIAVTAGRGQGKAVAQQPADVVAPGPETTAAKDRVRTKPAPAKDVRSDVLNVRTTPAVADVPSAADTTLRARPDNAAENVELEAIGKPIAVPVNVKRVVGLQYLVLLSFPREEDAKDLVKFLAQNGVPATAERALPGYAKSWTSVVSVRSFDHTKGNPAYDRYAAALTNLLQKYAGGDKFRRTFKIDVYKWRTAH